jgi:uncharacterized protein YaaN involved in tellurite resistance
MEARMANNEQTGVDKCLTDPKFRDTLQNHSTDSKYVSDELDRIGIVFKDDGDGKKRKAVIDQIANINWKQLEDLEGYLNKAESAVQPLMG